MVGVHLRLASGSSTWPCSRQGANVRAGVRRVCDVHYPMLKPLADLSVGKHLLSCALVPPETLRAINLVHHEWGAAEWLTCMNGASMGGHAWEGQP